MYGKKKPYIEVEFDVEGDPVIEGHGFTGGACEKATKFLEKALGLIKSRSCKVERWQKDVQNVQSH
jgi:hypothetical protein